MSGRRRRLERNDEAADGWNERDLVGPKVGVDMKLGVDMKNVDVSDLVEPDELDDLKDVNERKGEHMSNEPEGGGAAKVANETREVDELLDASQRESDAGDQEQVVLGHDEPAHGHEDDAHHSADAVEFWISFVARSVARACPPCVVAVVGAATRSGRSLSPSGSGPGVWSAATAVAKTSSGWNCSGVGSPCATSVPHEP